MQKVLRLSVLNRNNAIKKTRKSIFEKRKDQEKEFEQYASRTSKLTREHRRSERRNRREDWVKGELATDRNTGLKRGIYGTLDASFVNTANVPKFLVGGEKMGLMEWNIVVGDRVCIVRGGQEVLGKIGTVATVASEKRTLTVKDLNMVSSRLI